MTGDTAILILNQIITGSDCGGQNLFLALFGFAQGSDGFCSGYYIFGDHIQVCFIVLAVRNGVQFIQNSLVDFFAFSAGTVLTPLNIGEGDVAILFQKICGENLVNFIGMAIIGNSDYRIAFCSKGRNCQAEDQHQCQNNRNELFHKISFLSFSGYFCFGVEMRCILLSYTRYTPQRRIRSIPSV